MTQKQNHERKASEHETQAVEHQAEAFGLAVRGDYANAYQALGKALAELKEANKHRKIAGVIEEDAA